MPENDREHVIAWFSNMSMVNMFAAAANPEDWARAQTRNDPDQYEEFVRRARIWVEHIESVGREAGV